VTLTRIGKNLTTIGIDAVGVGIAALALRIATSRHPIGNPSVARPVKTVDLVRYLGRWYEIARYEQIFEQGQRGVTADYALNGNGTISVVNAGITPNGATKMVRGTAKVVDRSTNARLKVSFFGPFYIGNYWVLDHADDYSWSIVGDPSGRYLWLLAREARPEPSEVQALIDRAEALGYDTSMLIRTVQP
jgi:apolipoprotein D and lipocalin family protein